MIIICFFLLVALSISCFIYMQYIEMKNYRDSAEEYMKAWTEASIKYDINAINNITRPPR